MRRITYAVAVLVVMGLVGVVSAEEKSPQKAGNWQIKFQVEMEGVPFKMPPFTKEICVTEEDLKDPQKAVPHDPKSQCTVSDHKIDGNKVT